MLLKQQSAKIYLILAAILIAIIFLYYQSYSLKNQNYTSILHYLSSPSLRFTPYPNEHSQIFKIEKIVQLNPCSHTDTTVTTNLCEYQKNIKLNLGIFDDSFMPKEALHTARLYINTIKYSVLNLFYVYFDGIIDGSKWPPQGSCQALTMTGIRRLDNLQMVLEDVILRQIDGDFIELGVWKGGLCILAKAIFHAYKQYDRRIFLADSFDGIPPVNLSQYPADRKHSGAHKLNILSSKYTGGVNAVKKNFNLYFNVESERDKIEDGTFRLFYGNEENEKEKEFQVGVEFLVGYFKDSLPVAIKENKFKCFSVLRLDGDIYESTWQSLEYLYPYLNVGGVVIVDDFSDWEGAFRAVHDFRRKHGIRTPIVQVFHRAGEMSRGVYFRKPEGAHVVSC